MPKPLRRTSPLVAPVSTTNFSIAKGEFSALLGGNGAGKSTTLLSFLGFVRPAKGKDWMWLDAVCADIASVRRLTAYLRQQDSLQRRRRA